MCELLDLSVATVCNHTSNKHLVTMTKGKLQQQTMGWKRPSGLRKWEMKIKWVLDPEIMKPCQFDNNYHVTETISSEVIGPKYDRVKNLNSTVAYPSAKEM